LKQGIEKTYAWIDQQVNSVSRSETITTSV